ncbi:hypothetical protein N658DRAFT_444292 [Parathielavia hyrcaniae]|uniref:Uncharacterized protein n=1 Tax=Parathielavia hyrcaniae TaxID=113614 RepID=A0AAN6Q669_9PEZI|nr:hypothetical protein N658DRAFT_444292 [Parathielavia hyrcaniae]
MAAVTRSLAAAGADAIVHERFAAVETGVMLSPREYHLSPAQPLGKRQDGCNPGSHPCNEIGPAGASICCPNNQYCIINPRTTTLGACCHLGATCDSPCPEYQFQCATTLTLTAAGTTTTTTSPACCNRTCPQTSMFQCPPSLGGGCCAYGARCATGGQCLLVVAPTTSSSSAMSLSVTPPPPGCSTGQISCAATLGGGCCAATQSCTLVSGRAHCAATPAPEPTEGEGVSVVDADAGAGGSLSPGATAGVAVGVVVACGLVIGAVTWWCLRRRRRRMGMGEGEGYSSSGSRSRPAGVVGLVVGGSGGREMSDANSDVVSGSGGRLAGLTHDYFGPAPGMGPYSEGASAVTTPGMERGGVPLQPNEPGDIAVPVEIDSRLQDATRRTPPAGLPIPPPRAAESHVEDGQERYELYGSDVGQISPTLPSPFAGGMPSPNQRPR